MSARQEHVVSAARVALGVGALLKQAREAAKLSCEEVAARTRLELKVVEALEREDYTSLAAAAFVKGYIRSISKVLDIDPAPVVAQFEQQEKLDDPALADFSTRSPTQITSSSKPILIVSVALAVGVLIMVALWWQRNYREGEQSADSLAKLAAEAALDIQADPGVPLPYAYTIVDHSAQPLAPVNSWRRQTDGSKPPAIEEPMPVALASENSERAPPPPDTPREATTPTAAPTTGELILEGKGESWIEVSDFAGKRLYFGMLKPGQRVAVTGTAPYDLVIGNAQAVRADFRGQAVDVRARAVNGVARFSLGDLQ